jgi:[acyl-carrier-protein] S-malonyltransferase
MHLYFPARAARPSAWARRWPRFDAVDEALGEKLSSLIWDGPESDLILTRNAQPALMAVSIAALRALETRGIDVPSQAAFVAGHSLGEYSALAAAGSLTLADTARLLRIRGDAMQEAVSVGEGAMAAILGLEIEEVRDIAESAGQGDVCAAANDNAPGQVVVSGTKAAVERAIDIAKARGARRALPLPVSAPFHCALMAPAAEAMADALAAIDINSPAVPIVVNVLAEPLEDPAQIRQRLVEQVTGAVRWRESVEWMAAHGVTQLVEIGAGKVLSGLARRISPDLTGMAAGTPDDIAKVADALASDA